MHLLEWQKSKKKLAIPNAGKNVELLELSLLQYSTGTLEVNFQFLKK